MVLVTGHSPLQWALAGRHEDTVEALLAAGGTRPASAGRGAGR
ncbi:hypothetical protein [Streptomyces bullii]|uniref:Ankyrin repeat-containing protein n=1 Tax=Streptomyces bullii TaxID=349910 RepID=A0ABW0ULK1_9ACTN